jgi:hypothetical protein
MLISSVLCAFSRNHKQFYIGFEIPLGVAISDAKVNSNFGSTTRALALLRTEGPKWSPASAGMNFSSSELRRPAARASSMSRKQRKRNDTATMMMDLFPSVDVSVIPCVIHFDGGTSNNNPIEVALVLATGLTG